jgi:hypothetical protein
MYGLQDESAPWGQLSGYMMRAQMLVQGRTPEEIRWGGVAVSWMRNEALPELQARIDPNPLPSVVPIGPSVAMLVHLRRHIPINAMDYFPNASWAELLAAYALDCIGQAHGAFQLKRDLTAADNEDLHQLARTLDAKFLADAFEASEAVHYAERIDLAREDVAKEAELYFTEQQRDRGVQRHAKSRVIIDKFVKFYLEEGDENRSQAARNFRKRLSPKDREAFTGNDESVERTLTRHLRIYLKDQVNDEN